MTIYKQIQRNKDLILAGSLLAIDPSSGSKNSKAGYAYYEAGELIESGIVDINHTLHITKRLETTYDFLVSKFNQPDILVIERIRGRLAHVFLLWAVGVSITAIRANILLELNSTIWRKLINKSEYIKSDEQDAILMGQAVIQLAESYDNE